MVATHGKLSEMIRAGYPQEKTAPEILDEAKFQTRFVRTSPLGREHLPGVRAEIEERAKPFAVLDERHIAATPPSPHWRQTLTTLSG